MKILMDQAAVRRLRLVGSATYDDVRYYYVADPETRFLLVTRNGHQVGDLAGRVVDANVGWETGIAGFCHDHHVGKRLTKVTVYRPLSAGAKPQQRLSQIMAKAPRDK